MATTIVVVAVLEASVKDYSTSRLTLMHHETSPATFNCYNTAFFYLLYFKTVDLLVIKDFISSVMGYARLSITNQTHL